MKKLVLTLALLTAGTSLAVAQARPAASRLGDLQVGATYSTAYPDFSDLPVVNRLRGFGFYSDFDFRRHLGVEVDFRQLNDPDDLQQFRISQRNYEAGGRYFWKFGRFKPYGKLLYGRGVFSVSQSDLQNQPSFRYPQVATNMLDAGAGFDFSVHPRINVRAEYEYQKWFSSHPPLDRGLTPTMFNFGVAYHFPPGKPRR